MLFPLQTKRLKFRPMLLKALTKPNDTPLHILFNVLKASVGLMLYGFGVYLTIQAGIGVSPWDTFHIGLSNTLGVIYGTAFIAVSVILIIIDILMKEPIGIGMILDAILVGKAVDLCNWLDIIPAQTNIFAGIGLMLVGLFIEGYMQHLYMSAGLGCGPRDTLLVALIKRFRKVPIGLVSIMILVIVTLLGWLLGGPIGIGTLIGAFLTGPIMQFAFNIAHFDPAKIKHQPILGTFKVLFGKQKKNDSDVQ